MLPEMEISSGLPSNTIRSLKLDEMRRLWVGTDNGLKVLIQNDSVSRKIVENIGRKSVWAISFFKDHVLIGTRFNGLYVYDFYSGKLLFHYSAKQISEIRKIKTIQERAFILTNRGSFEWKRGKLEHLEVEVEKPGSFIIDLFIQSDSIFGLLYPAKEFRLLKLNRFENIKFLPTQLRQEMGHLFSSFGDNRSVVFGGTSENQSIIWKLNKGGKIIRQASVHDLGNATIVWQIESYDSLVISALGNTNTNENGAFFVSNIETIPPITGLPHYITCFEVDSVLNMVYIGTLNRGLFLKHIVVPRSRKLMSDMLVLRNGKKPDSEFLLGDTLVSVYADSVLIRNVKLAKTIVSFVNDSDMLIHIAKVVTKGNYLYLFDSYGQAYAYNFTTEEFKMTGVKSTFPYVQTYGDTIFLLNREQGFNYIIEDTAFSLKTPSTEIGFVSDFTYAKNKLYTLSKTSVEIFDVDWKRKALLYKSEFPINDLVVGFTPKWIDIHKSEIVLIDNCGLLFLDLITGKPKRYFYMGQYNEIEKPTFSDDKVNIQNSEIQERIHLSSIPLSQQNGFQIDIPDELNENTDFSIRLISPSYVAQTHMLKKIDIRKEGRLVKTQFILGDVFSLNGGLPYGKYTATISAEGFEKEFSFNISIPLGRNPFFFGGLSLVLLMISGLLWKSLIDRKRLHQKTAENKILVLNQNLNPHFVYNSLNLITALVLEEKYDEAVEAISEFSKLQRTFLETNQLDSISLEKELAILKSYLDMQKKRFQHDNRFNYSINIPDEFALHQIVVPPFILQPLVENAVKYGISPDPLKEKWIRIYLIREGKFLLLHIENSIAKNNNKENSTTLGNKLVAERIKVFNQTTKNKIAILPQLINDGLYRVTLQISL